MTKQVKEWVSDGHSQRQQKEQRRPSVHSILETKIPLGNITDTLSPARAAVRDHSHSRSHLRLQL